MNISAIRTKRNKKAFLPAAIAVLLLASVSALAFSAVFSKTASGDVQPVSLFESRDNVAVVMNQKAGAADSRTGVLLSTLQNGARVEVKDTLAGPFEIEYKVFSERVISIYRIIVSVTDKGGNSVFSYITEGSSASKVKSWLQRDGVKASNETYVDSAFFGTEHDSIRLSFDQSSESISINGLAFGHSLPGGTVKGLSEYKIAVTFNGVAGKAELIVYSLMGQSLQGLTLRNNSAPSIYLSELKYNGAIGGEFNLPEFISYDVIDKNEHAAFSLRIIQPNGTSLILAKGVYSFVPAAAGNYSAVYIVTDSGGLLGTVSLDFKVFEASAIISETVPAKKIAGGEGLVLGRGTQFTFPSARVRTNYAVSGYAEAKLTINGAVFDANVPTRYAFDNAGVFTAEYSPKDSAPGSVVNHTVTVNVTDSPVFVIPEIEAVYAQAAFFNAPAATAAYGGNGLNTSHKLYMPDGSVGLGQNIPLEYVGEYMLEYTAAYNGTDYFAYRYFNVRTNADALIKCGEGWTFSANADSPSYAVARNGIKLTSSLNNTWVTYANPIDFTGKTHDDTLLEFLIMPKTYNTMDVSGLTIRFTDIENPNNYITVNTRPFDPAAGLYAWSSAWASSGNNTLYAVRGSGVVPGNWFIGAEILTSFFGAGEAGQRAPTAVLTIDYAERTLRMNGTLILDLDNPLHVGEGGEWEGFSSGKALMSVSAAGLPGSILLLNVGGQYLSGEMYSDDLKREFVVNCGEGNVPLAQVDAPYRIFGAYLQSALSGKMFDYDVNVYRDYGALSPQKYQITNGCFTPDEAGTYTLVYSSGDALKTVEIEARSPLDGLLLSVDNGFFGGVFYTGETVTLPKVNIDGGSLYGYSEIITATKDGQPVALEDGAFTPTATGTYNIVYSVADYVGNTETLPKSLTVTARGTPFFIGEVKPNNGIMLNGAEYVIPEFDAYEYMNGGLATIKTSAGIKYGGGEIQWLGADRKYTPNVNNDCDTIEVVYRAVSAVGGGTVYSSDFIPVTVIVLKPSDYSGYFYGDGVSRAVQSEGIGNAKKDFVQLGSFGEAEISFVNLLPAFLFSIDFAVPATGGVNGVTFILADSRNPSVSISFGLFKNGQDTRIYLNGGYLKTMRLAEFERSWSIQYNSLIGTIDNNDNNVPLAALRTALNGKPFTGFPSQKVFLTVITETAAGQGFIRISRLCGHTLNLNYSDRTDPVVSFLGFNTSAKINENFVIPVFTVVDIIDPNPVVVLTFTAPDGTRLLLNVSGNQSYTLNLTQYGEYILNLTATDKSGGRAVRTQAISVRNELPPQIKTNGNVPQEGRVNKKISLPSAGASDYANNNLTVDVYIIAPNGSIAALSDKAGFIPDCAGFYKIIYYAQDSFANYDMKIFEITVNG